MSYLPQGQREDIQHWQSTVVTPKGEHFRKDLVPTTENYIAGLNDKQKKQVSQILRKVPGFADIDPNLETGVKQFEDRVVENLHYIWDSVPEDVRQRSKLWYVGGRAIVDRFAKDYGITTQQAAAIVASLSPQKGWQENVRMAQLICEALTNLNDQKTTVKQLTFLRRSALTAVDKKIAEAAGAVQKLQLRRKALKNPESIAAWESDLQSLQRKASRSELEKTMEEMNGKTLGELSDDYARALWIRSWWDGEKVSKRVPDISPEGDFLPKPAVSELGKPLTLRWQSYVALKKAVAAFRSPNRKVLSDALGRAHKVRNFNNNLLLPDLKEMQDVTIDTHAAAAAAFNVFGASDYEAKWAMGTGSPKGNDINGGYGIYADAYRRAAAERGVLAREMQSVTWEGLRNLFASSFKSQNKQLVNEIWHRAERGEITRQQARDEIVKAAGGWKAPSWYHP